MLGQNLAGTMFLRQRTHLSQERILSGVLRIVGGSHRNILRTCISEGNPKGMCFFTYPYTI